MRALSQDEVKRVAGGDDDIVINGTQIYDARYWYFVPDHFFDFDPGFGNGDGSPAPASSNNGTSVEAGYHHIDLANIQRILTNSEQTALNHFKESLARNDAAIDLLSPTDQFLVQTKNGYQAVTGADIQNLWHHTNFIINDNNKVYANGTDRGQSDFNEGNPVSSFNIKTLEGFDRAPGGMNYLPLHELGHLVEVGRINYNDAAKDGVYTSAERQIQERLANDVAAAIQQHDNQVVYRDNTYGYSDDIMWWNTAGDKDP